MHIMSWRVILLYSVYKVQDGDTLATVAQKYGILVNDLSQLNGIMVGAVLTPGDYIIVPKMDNDNIYFSKYTIKNGDTIYSIARRYNINPKFLLRLNGLNESDIVYAGDSIFVPREGVEVYITGNDDTLNNVLNGLNISPNDLVNQNSTIYLTNDQLILYRR